MLTATCGACKGKHETIAEYRTCSGAPQTDAQVMDNVSGQTTTANPPSDRQVKYALDLLESRVWPDGFSDEDLRGMERRQVSNLIDALHKAPRKAQDRRVGAKGSKTPEWNDIPAGRYALPIFWPPVRKDGSVEKGDPCKFYEVQKPKQGQWAGRTFVKILIGSPGDYRKDRLRREESIKVLERIREITPKQASINYGIAAEVCGVCSSPLTNPDSIAYGIGPKCRNKMGW